MTTYQAIRGLQGGWRIQAVNHDTRTREFIAECPTKLWADRIVNALNQMEIES
jgi:hypothetical protein